jgi:hypothetical protein
MLFLDLKIANDLESCPITTMIINAKFLLFYQIIQDDTYVILLEEEYCAKLSVKQVVCFSLPLFSIKITNIATP